MKTIPDAVLTYVEAWNENNPARRQALLQQCWAEDGVILTPRELIEGRDALAARIAGFREQCLQDRGELTSEIQVCGNWFRFTATVVRPDGSRYSDVLDVGEVNSAGQIQRIITFIEPLKTVSLNS